MTSIEDEDPIQHSVDWLTEFKEKNGRPPKVLHIGNIANNAYNNAKLLNQAGLDCDVICADYYHAMGCPEWEDADFRGQINDPFFPSFLTLDLRGFQRPKWFVQGSLKVCIQYLLARRMGQPLKAQFYWLLLSFEQFERSYNCSVNEISIYKPLVLLYILILKTRTLVSKKRNFFLKIHATLSSWILKIHGKGRKIVNIAQQAYLKVLKSLSRRDSLKYEPTVSIEPETSAPNSSSEVSTPNKLEEFNKLYSKFLMFFPDRKDIITKEDVIPYLEVLPLWTKLFDSYDIIQGYSTDPIYPMLAGEKSYVAYEHGTIRDIPFNDSNLGRLTALSYRLASHVFITNPDCLSAALKLELSNYSYTPHVIDSKYYRPRNNDFRNFPYIFCPARQDWNVKGNDLAIRGFELFHQEYPQYHLLISSWGADLERSKELVTSLKLSTAVEFVSPLNVSQLIQASASASVLIDQFMGYFGGIAPTALAVGTPLIMHLDYSKYDWCFKSPPPYFEASNAEEVFTALCDALNVDRNHYSENARKWVKDNYWYGQVVKDHLNVYSKLIP